MGMNTRWKQPWIDALESGEYVQTQSALYDGTGYCCLGVLCRIAGAEFQRVVTTHGHDYEPTLVDGIQLNDGQELSNDGRKMFGLDCNQESTLIGLNDGGMRAGTSKTFKEIAAYIRANL